MKDKQSNDKDELRMMNMLLEAEQSGKSSLSERLFGGDGFGWMVFFVVLAVVAAAGLMVVRVLAPEMLGGGKAKAETHAEAPAKPVQVAPPKVEQLPKAEMQPIVVEETDQQKEKKIVLALEDWAKAWSAKDLNKYFSTYSADFAPAKNMKRQEWEAERKEKITSREEIKVQLKDIKVQLDGKKAVVTLKQNYQADDVSISGRKVFDLVQEGDRWLIQREANQ